MNDYKKSHYLKSSLLELGLLNLNSLVEIKFDFRIFLIHLEKIFFVCLQNSKI